MNSQVMYDNHANSVEWIGSQHKRNYEDMSVHELVVTLDREHNIYNELKQLFADTQSEKAADDLSRCAKRRGTLKFVLSKKVRTDESLLAEVIVLRDKLSAASNEKARLEQSITAINRRHKDAIAALAQDALPLKRELHRINQALNNYRGTTPKQVKKLQNVVASNERELSIHIVLKGIIRDTYGKDTYLQLIQHASDIADGKAEPIKPKPENK